MCGLETQRLQQCLKASWFEHSAISSLNQYCSKVYTGGWKLPHTWGIPCCRASPDHTLSCYSTNVKNLFQVFVGGSPSHSSAAPIVKHLFSSYCLKVTHQLFVFHKEEREISQRWLEGALSVPERGTTCLDVTQRSESWCDTRVSLGC